MPRHAITAADSQPPGLVGQGLLSLPDIGETWLVWSELGLLALALPGRTDSVEAELVEQGLVPPPVAPVPKQYAEPLIAYARGAEVDPAELPVDLRGTDFQCRVWQALRRIPRGAVRSYGAIALEVGAPRGMRAVGAANGRNPIAIVVPCHRVIEAGARLGGYSGGLSVKKHLLRLEGVRVDGERVVFGQLGLWDE